MRVSLKRCTVHTRITSKSSTTVLDCCLPSLLKYSVVNMQAKTQLGRYHLKRGIWQRMQLLILFIYLLFSILFFRTSDSEQDVKLPSLQIIFLYIKESIDSPLTAAWTSLSVNTVWVEAQRSPWFARCPSQMTSFITSLHPPDPRRSDKCSFFIPS